MPWYYAGTDAKPVGPITLEELQARRHGGAVSPDTYVIEYTGQPTESMAWKRYRELFPAVISAPVIPPPPLIPISIPPPLATQAHPLFPSVRFPSGTPPGQPPATEKSNAWCAWGFGLSLGSLILLLPSCGLTAFIALPALVFCVIGLVQIQHNHAQAGRNLAVTGLILSGVTLLITIIVLAVAVPIILKSHGQFTTTEQSNTDSE